jgi:hypothetical protein
MTASGYQATIKEMPESERPRERMQQEGPHVLSNAELIGIILSSGTQKSVPSNWEEWFYVINRKVWLFFETVL